ncbi:hypothetical protein PTKU46_25550 [Paraburkholderia terrae]|uniref:hypothetical protein n=1 Tax=Paraburkholderia terrae TaxID=311230 RepID=UPI0030E3F9C2
MSNFPHIGHDDGAVARVGDFPVMPAGSLRLFLDAARCMYGFDKNGDVHYAKGAFLEARLAVWLIWKGEINARSRTSIRDSNVQKVPMMRDSAEWPKKSPAA